MREKMNEEIKKAFRLLVDEGYLTKEEVYALIIHECKDFEQKPKEKFCKKGRRKKSLGVDEFIKKNYSSMKAKDIAKKVGITIANVYARADTLGIKKIKFSKRNKMSKQKKWTQSDDKIIITYYNTIPIKQLAEKLGRDISDVKTRIYDLNTMGKIKND